MMMCVGDAEVSRFTFNLIPNQIFDQYFKVYTLSAFIYPLCFYTLSFLHNQIWQDNVFDDVLSVRFERLYMTMQRFRNLFLRLINGHLSALEHRKASRNLSSTQICYYNLRISLWKVKALFHNASKTARSPPCFLNPYETAAPCSNCKLSLS